MLQAHKSIPAITQAGNQFFITTDERLCILELSSYLISITGKSPKVWQGISIQSFFTKNYLHTDTSFPKAITTGSPFYVEAGITLPGGKSIATLWVVTPVFDEASGKVKEFRWTGCQINDTQFHDGRQLNKSVEDFLKNVGASLKADRAIVFQLQPDADKKSYTLRKQGEWNSTANKGQVPNSRLMNLPASKVNDILEVLQNGGEVNSLVRDLENNWLSERLRSDAVQSFLSVPIFMNGAFWGNILVEQCLYERVWTVEDVSTLNALACFIAGTVESKETDKKLKDSEEKFKILFHNSLDIIFVVDETGKIKYVTPGIESALGFKDEDLINKKAYDYIHGDDTKKLKQEFRHLIADPEYIALANIRVKNSKNEWIWMEARGQNKSLDLNINGIILSFRDITERHHAQEAITEFSETITGILNSITDGFAALDKNFTIKLWNHIAEKLTGIKKDDIVGKNLWEQFPGLINSTKYVEFKKALQKKAAVNFEQHIPTMDRWFHASVHPYEEGLYIYFRDITIKKKEEMLLTIEKNVLQANSNPESTLKSSVDFFLEGIENINPEIFSSVLLLDESQKWVRHLSAPRLPQQFTEAIDGMPIGPNEASFSAAMCSKKMVIVEDIENHPLWINYRDIALEHTLKACLSIPILDAQYEVVGSLVCYYKKTKLPTEEEINLIERSANLLRIIIENKRAEEKIRLSNDRYKLATRAINEAIWDWDVKTDELYWGEAFYSMFGYKTNYKVNTFNFWMTHIHPDDRNQVRTGMEDFMKNKTPHLWMDEYRFKRSDGNYAIVVNKGYLIYDKKGEMLRMVGSLEDVTEKKHIQKKLIKEEIDKQKVVANAVLDALEKERATIGKELHDNVNQVLSTAKLFLEVAKSNAKERPSLIRRSAEQIHHAINEIRNISQSLVPPSISDLGLTESIKDLVENIAVKKTLKVEYNNIGDIETAINHAQKIMLFRIIQEQVNNVLKHAEAKHLFIQLLVDEIGIELVITDDGKGFDPEKIKTQKGVGLSNIASRVELFNGSLKIITAPDKGCKLIVKVTRIH